MPRRVFYSFYFDEDCMRSSQVRTMGALDGNRPAQPNEWESLKRTGDEAIKRWIDGQLHGRSCTVVLVGSQTATRPWVQYEIRRSWELRMGLLGIHIHNLKDPRTGQSRKGANPFVAVWPEGGSVIPIHDPPYYDGSLVYRHIADNIEQWIDAAIAFRASQK